MIDLKNVELAEHIFSPFLCHFHVLIQKMPALAVSHLTVTLRMMSNNQRSFSSIGAVHVKLIQQVCYSLDEELKHDVTYWMIAAIF